MSDEMIVAVDPVYAAEVIAANDDRVKEDEVIPLDDVVQPKASPEDGEDIALGPAGQEEGGTSTMRPVASA
jgi:hypothetical protein